MSSARATRCGAATRAEEPERRWAGRLEGTHERVEAFAAAAMVIFAQA